MVSEHPFEQFLKSFIPKAAEKSTQFNQALWLLETTGTSDAANLKAKLDAELRLLFGNLSIYEKFVEWERDPSLQDPLLKRQLNVITREFKQNIIPKKLIEQISKKETELLYTYANFRPKLNGKTLSDNDLRDLLKKENDPSIRQKGWEASKEIGEILAPHILSLVELRNQSAQSLGYSDYFEMQLDLHEVNETWLFHFLNEFAYSSASAHATTLQNIEEHQCQKFGVSKEELGPWAWSDFFGQEDPIDTDELDALVAEIDICNTCVKFYQQIGFDVLPVLQRSDMYERPGKNQHAFCINIDRKEDVRTLNNVKSSLRWLETVLHEFGHAVYELHFYPTLPWLLRKPAHMMLTEGVALLAGRQAYFAESLPHLLGSSINQDLVRKAEESLKRRQLIFSRWVLVMTYFEKELYRNPSQDLNQIWWDMVNKYQKISPPKNRDGKMDWAAKYHIAFEPAYYYNYLLGELFASSIEESLFEETGSRNLISSKAALFLQQKLFPFGSGMNWANLVTHVTGHPLSSGPWISQFCNV